MLRIISEFLVVLLSRKGRCAVLVEAEMRKFKSEKAKGKAAVVQ